MSVTLDTTYERSMALTFDEEDVLRDLLGSTREDDRRIDGRFLNAFHTLRIKSGLAYSAARGVDVTEAVAATERVAAYARARDAQVRLYFDWDRTEYQLLVGSRAWRWDTLYTLLPRVARELGLTQGTGCV